MSSQNNNNIADAEARHEQAFGEFVYMPEDLREKINAIKNNSQNVKRFQMIADDVDSLSDLAWQLLGRYIAKNTHLEVIRLTKCSLNDNHMRMLMQGLVRSESINEIDLSSTLYANSNLNNHLGVDGIRSMIPFLQNSPRLSVIDLNHNQRIGSEAFESLVSALDGGAIEELHLVGCRIEDISALGNTTLPHLKTLSLINNNINLIGDISSCTSLESLNLSGNLGVNYTRCRAIAHLLQNEESRLETLNLDRTGIDDEGVEILMASLKHNTTLRTLYLRVSENYITIRGYQAILKLLIDVSSIDNTYTSNHTVEELFLPTRLSSRHINFALSKNRHYHHAGKQKIIHYQFNHLNRTELATLQGITPPTHNSVYVQIDPVVLPDVLAMIGENCTHSDMYLALTATASDLTSLVNKPAVFRERIEKNERKAAALTADCERKVAALKAECESKVAALTAKNLKMKEELELFQSNEQNQARGTKRDRS